jgi:hypothetical protein
MGVKKSKPNMKAVLAGSTLGACLGVLLILAKYFHFKWFQALLVSLVAYALFSAFLGWLYLKHRREGAGLSAENIARDRQEAADLIEGFLQGSLGVWAWDDFISVSQRVPELEQIRRECADLPHQFPPEQPGEYCNQQGLQVLRGYLRQLRGEV